MSTVTVPLRESEASIARRETLGQLARSKTFLIGAVVLAFWVFWVVTLYAAMVVLRCLGLFYYRQAIVLDWFPDRTRSARQA